MQPPYTFTGHVHHIGKLQTFSSGFAKRVLVVRSDDADAKYPAYGAFEFIKGKSYDKTNELNRLSVGDKVRVSFYLDANENRNNPGQWFSSCKGAKIDVLSATRSAPPPPCPDNAKSEYKDDFPF